MMLILAFTSEKRRVALLTFSGLGGIAEAFAFLVPLGDGSSVAMVTLICSEGRKQNKTSFSSS